MNLKIRWEKKKSAHKMVPIVDSLFFPPQLKKNKKLEQGQNSTVQI